MAKFYYGGQAVMEGVMMRGQKHMAVAVRAPGGNIVIHEEPLNSMIYRNPVMKMPFLRGLVGLWDALGLGMKALMFSANVAMEEETKPTEAASPKSMSIPGTNGQPASASKQEGSKGQDALGAAAWSSIAIALAMMVGIFFVLPVLAASFITSVANSDSTVLHNVIEGAIRLGLFLAYIWVIGFMPDIKRVFGYHGAEHKTINAYEAGVELTPEKVQEFTLLNPRCGTTFLLIVMLLATLLFIVIGKLPFPVMVLSRIVLVPVVATVAYEFIRLMANLYGNPVVRAIMAPGLALQKMTTRPPDLTMIEVGIAALNAVLVADGVVAKAEAGTGNAEWQPVTTEERVPAIVATQ
ncbi:MAG: DUF1385 domain-containing protein [Chloroflexota bacterium]